MVKGSEAPEREQPSAVPGDGGGEVEGPAGRAGQGAAGQAAEAAAGAAGERADQEPAASREELERELEAARREAAEQREALLRARAELENLRRRTAREVENAHKYGLEAFVQELLPVKDSIELGLGAAADGDVDLAKVREGLELTLKLFVQATEKFGLTEVDPAGQPFDPQYHQAMSMQEVEGTEPGTVVSVIQKGYLLNDRLVRPAMVIVAK